MTETDIHNLATELAVTSTLHAPFAKQAAFGDQLQQYATQAMDTAKPYAGQAVDWMNGGGGYQPALRTGAVGAGIGGLGALIASLTMKKNKDDALKDALWGALLGGGAGAAGQLLMSPPTAQSTFPKAPGSDAIPAATGEVNGQRVPLGAGGKPAVTPQAAAGLGVPADAAPANVTMHDGREADSVGFLTEKMIENAPIGAATAGAGGAVGLGAYGFSQAKHRNAVHQHLLSQLRSQQIGGEGGKSLDITPKVDVDPRTLDGTVRSTPRQDLDRLLNDMLANKFRMTDQGRVTTRSPWIPSLGQTPIDFARGYSPNNAEPLGHAISEAYGKGQGGMPDASKALSLRKSLPTGILGGLGLGAAGAATYGDMLQHESQQNQAIDAAARAGHFN